MSVFLGLLAIFEVVGNIIFMFSMLLNVDSDTTPLKVLINWICKMYNNKNIFGKILSTLIIIIFLPGCVLLLVAEITVIIFVLFYILWDLGKKKN